MSGVGEKVCRSKGYLIRLQKPYELTAQFSVPPIARHVALSAGGRHIATSDGTDVFTFDANGAHRTTIRIQPSGRTATTTADESHWLPSRAASSVRLRRGDTLIRRGSTDYNAAWEELTTGDIPL